MKRLSFSLCLVLLFFAVGCRDDNTAHNEKTISLLAELKKQQIELAEQIKNNSETLRKLETQNQQLKKLLERQQSLLSSYPRRPRRALSDPRYLNRMIESMSRKNPPSKVAEVLNRRNIQNPKGGSWTEQGVQDFLKKSRSSKSPKKQEGDN